MTKTIQHKSHKYSDPFPQMLVGRANCLFHLHSLIAPLAHHLDFTFIYLFIYFVSPALSEHNPHVALCLCSLRIFQPTDGIFFLLLLCFCSFFPLSRILRQLIYPPVTLGELHLLVHVLTSLIPVYVSVITATFFFSLLLFPSANTFWFCFLNLSHSK